MPTTYPVLTLHPGAVEPPTSPERGVCRGCGAPLRHTVVDLGMSPLCESYIRHGQLDAVERFYPLHVLVCDACFLVQLQQYVSREAIFSDYAYFSSYSDSWLAHARRYTDQMVERFGLTAQSQVVEVASQAFCARRYRLVEAAAGAVAQAILDRFPQVLRVRVTVHKPHAPIAATFAGVGVTIVRDRQGRG